MLPLSYSPKFLQPRRGSGGKAANRPCVNSGFNARNQNLRSVREKLYQSAANRRNADRERQQREADMAKGQTRSNREIRKPKKSATEKAAKAGQSAGSVTATFAKPMKGKK
jgi:hypothetical protein